MGMHNVQNKYSSSEMKAKVSKISEDSDIFLCNCVFLTMFTHVSTFLVCLPFLVGTVVVPLSHLSHLVTILIDWLTCCQCYKYNNSYYYLSHTELLSTSESRGFFGDKLLTTESVYTFDRQQTLEIDLCFFSKSVQNYSME